MTALRFAQEGARSVHLVDHFQERLDSVADEVSAFGAATVTILAELSRIEECGRAVRHAVSEAGRLDVVVSNAAAWTQEPFLEMQDESWLKVIAVNLTASFVVGQRTARAMVEAAAMPHSSRSYVTHRGRGYSLTRGSMATYSRSTIRKTSTEKTPATTTNA